MNLHHWDSPGLSRLNPKLLDVLEHSAQKYEVCLGLLRVVRVAVRVILARQPPVAFPSFGLDTLQVSLGLLKRNPSQPVGDGRCDAQLVKQDLRVHHLQGSKADYSTGGLGALPYFTGRSRAATRSISFHFGVSHPF